MTEFVIWPSIYIYIEHLLTSLCTYLIYNALWFNVVLVNIYKQFIQNKYTDRIKIFAPKIVKRYVNYWIMGINCLRYIYKELICVDIYQFWLFCFWLFRLQRLLNYLVFQSLDFVRTLWWLFQKIVERTKFDIHISIKSIKY